MIVDMVGSDPLYIHDMQKISMEEKKCQHGCFSPVKKSSSQLVESITSISASWRRILENGAYGVLGLAGSRPVLGGF